VLRFALEIMSYIRRLCLHVIGRVLLKGRHGLRLRKGQAQQHVSIEKTHQLQQVFLHVTCDWYY